jgi:hypothetical protein
VITLLDKRSGKQADSGHGSLFATTFYVKKSGGVMKITRFYGQNSRK